MLNIVNIEGKKKAYYTIQYERNSKNKQLYKLIHVTKFTVSVLILRKFIVNLVRTLELHIIRQLYLHWIKK